MLCHLANQFPPFVANFLERSRPLRRRFREETITDLLMGSLITAGGKRVIVEFPNEPVTGADMEWNFANPDDGTFFRILLQAKQSSGEGMIWRRHCYKELLHKPRGSSTLQAVALCTTARAEPATYPLYIFYHPERTCVAAEAAKCAAVAGVSLADGYQIEHLVTGATTRTLRTRNKSLKEIEPLLFSLTDLFCPPTIQEIGPLALRPGAFLYPLAAATIAGRPITGVPVPPEPTVIRNRIVSIREAQSEAQIQRAEELPPVAEVSNEIPREVRSVIERRRAGAPSEQGLNRWRVTFVSSSPRDIDAELQRLRRLEDEPGDT